MKANKEKIGRLIKAVNDFALETYYKGNLVQVMYDVTDDEFIDRLESIAATAKEARESRKALASGQE